MGPAPGEPAQRHADAATTIQVQGQSWQRLQVSASALLPLHAHQVFALITHPRNEQIFRHLERCTHHQVLHDEPAAGRRLVESEHVARWSLLGLSGLLQTRLRVEQDFRARQASFALVPSRLNPLRTFDGRWVVHEQPPEACAHFSTGGSSGSGADHSTQHNACSLLTLEQRMQPAVPLPPPLGGVLKQLACKQLRGIFADLQREAARINSGQPTLWSHSA